MRLIWMLIPFAMQPAWAQDVASLKETMKLLQDTLNQQGPVSWVQSPKKTSAEGAAESMKVTNVMSDATADACTLSFKVDLSYPTYRVAITWILPVQDVARITVESVEAAAERFRAEAKAAPWGSTTTPVVFNLQVYALSGKKFATHRRSVNADKEIFERDQQLSPAAIIFREEETARRFAKAMEHAKELCPAGN